MIAQLLLLAYRPQSPDERPGLAAKLEEGFTQIERRIQSLLDANLIHAGQRLPLRLNVCNLATISEEVVDELNSLHGGRIVLKSEKVCGNWSAEELRRALWNLTGNAMASGGPSASSIVLQRAGKHTVRACKPHGPRVPLRYDREAASVRARELRAQGLSLSKIGQRLRKERLTPLRGGIWYLAQVAELLRGAAPGDREAATRRAAELRAQGMHLREIGVRLVTEGFLPKEGGIWHPAQVHGLLASVDSGLSAE